MNLMKKKKKEKKKLCEAEALFFFKNHMYKYTTKYLLTVTTSWFSINIKTFNMAWPTMQ